MNLGIVGTGIANTITYALGAMLNIFFTWTQKDIQEAIFWPDRRTFQDLWVQIKLGAAGSFEFAIDAGGNVVIDIISGWIGVKEQAAQIVLINITETLWMSAAGIN